MSTSRAPRSDISANLHGMGCIRASNGGRESPDRGDNLQAYLNQLPDPPLTKADMVQRLRAVRHIRDPHSIQRLAENLLQAVERHTIFSQCGCGVRFAAAGLLILEYKP